MARPIWKGNLTFGLVNVPVTLYSGEKRADIHLHLIDSRNQARVRYERVNSESGEEVPWNAIVKGYEFDSGQYVLLSAEELEKVDAELTRTIEIEDFVDAQEIDLVYFDKPYYLEPGKRGEKTYALLRETLRLTQKAGICRVVIRSREYLAAVMVRGEAIVLMLLRFAQELRDPVEFKLPDVKKDKIKISQREVDLAVKLVEEMTAEWDPERYHDEHRDQLMKYIDEKVKRGELTASQLEDAEEDDEDEGEENVVDLMDYLRRSVEKVQDEPAKKKATKKATKKTARKQTAKKAARKTSKTKRSA
ncbi:MAG: Ku protein [Verrucomicrobiota bacterium JB022]|nr:Ku protein [Verrucomicrobiota bacterium JB022]